MKENNPGYSPYGRPLDHLELPSFSSSMKWRGADLQTMRNRILGPTLRIEGEFQRIFFDIGEDQKLAASLHKGADQPNKKPLIIILHGVTGSEESANVISSTAYLTSLGFPVLRLNLRGAGPSAEVSTGPYHGGLTEDLKKVFKQLPEMGLGDDYSLYGISLGGNMMLKCLGEMGALAPVVAAVSISAPLCLKATQQRMAEKRNSLYHGYILLGMKTEAKLSGESHTAALREVAQSVRRIYDFDDQYVAAVHGMDGAEDYYASQSSAAYVDEITCPTLLIQAENDPWIPSVDYHRKDWSEDGPLSVLITCDGGHVGFHDNGSPIPWHDRVAARFFQDKTQ